MQIEKRLAAAPFSEVAGRVLAGYSVLFGVETKIGDFTEVFERGAFTETLTNRRDGLRDVVLALNHDPNQVIARQSNSSLAVVEDAKGLKFEAKLADLAIADETIKAVKAGLIGGISVGFVSVEEEWPTNNRRIIKRADLIEISVISGHAATLPTKETVSVRSLHKQAESDLMRRLYTFYLSGA